MLRRAGSSPVARTNKTEYADMAESADALDSGSSRGNSVEVQVLLSAPLAQKGNNFYELLPFGLNRSL